MGTNVVIDDQLMGRALKMGAHRTKRATIEPSSVVQGHSRGDLPLSFDPHWNERMHRLTAERLYHEFMNTEDKP